NGPATTWTPTTGSSSSVGSATGSPTSGRGSWRTRSSRAPGRPRTVRAPGPELPHTGCARRGAVSGWADVPHLRLQERPPEPRARPGHVPELRQRRRTAGRPEIAGVLGLLHPPQPPGVVVRRDV